MKKASLIASGILLVFLVGGWLAGSLLGLEGRDPWVLRGGLWALGLLAAVLIFFYLRARAAKSAPGAATTLADDEIDLAVRAARKRLATAPATAGAKLGKLPVLLVMGARGSAKTTTILHSGLEPELLAGEVHRGEVVVPTAAANLWYSQEMIVVEAGGPLLDEPARWSRLLRHIQPSRLAAALTRRRQAPRAALVCFPCDELVRSGNSEAVPAAARKLRQRLAEVAQQLGVKLPVYVLFTKADRLPYFEDYVRSFTREEAQQVLGATLPLATDASVGTFAERESARLGEAFGGIFHSLALKRLEVLPREAQNEVRAGAYEFPREIRKVRDRAVEFLVELCKPSQLAVSPFLRGFYFTGVRPIVVSEAAAAEAPPISTAAPRIALGATSVFDARQLQEAAAAARPSSSGGSRRVPEWVFLRRVFREVIARDEQARGVTGGGARINVMRRAMLGAAAGVFLLLCLGLTVSYANNRGLARDALIAAREIEQASVAPATEPPLDALQRLEALRSQTARLGEYERHGRPWRLAWGLYTGSTLYPGLRRLYFDRFERLVWGGARQDLLGALAALPETPNESSDYGHIYDALKAHLITTTHPRESTPAFLTPVLLRHWAAAPRLDGERLELAHRQLDFFADELPHGNPYRDVPAEQVVERTRALLRRFTDAERLYQVLLADAARAYPSLQFHRLVPDAEPVLRNPYEVPAAFTKQGWASVQTSLADVDRLFSREPWVVAGELGEADRVKLAQELRTRYQADYLRHWQDYLRSGAVVTGGDVGVTARRLEQLSGNQSPLLRMLAIAAQHTAVDTLEIGKAFQPVHLFVPPDITDRFVSDANAGYISALGGLQATLAQATAATGPARALALSQAAGNAEQVRGEVRNLAQNFVVEGAARDVGNNVQRLLQQPLSGIDAVIVALPAAEANEQGQSFCAQLQPVLAKYPFRPGATSQATLDEVAAAFQPGASALWAFHDDMLRELVVRQGARYGARVGASPAPTTSFLDFFNRAATISRAFFGDTGTQPEVVFSLRPQTTDLVPEITVTVDGQSRTFTRTMAAAQSFAWTGAQGMRMSARIAGIDTPLLESQGTWGAFRIFQQADWSALDGGRYSVRWRIPGQTEPLTAEVGFAGGIPIFRPDLLPLSCVAQVAR